MNLLKRLFQSSIGRKILMAGSGVVLVLFAIGHMVGNLQLFLGPEALNRYAHLLQSNREILWIVRLTLLGMVGLHVWSAISLSLENKAARPVDYGHGQTPFGASLASRTMLAGGIIIVSFVIYHLLHYTARVEAVNLTGRAFAGDPFAYTLESGTKTFDVHKMVILGFSKPLVVLFYALGVGFLCLHLSHGISAMFQSLGLRDHNWAPRLACAARIVSIALCVGYLAIPAAVLLGYERDRLADLKTVPVSAPASATPAAVQEAR